MLRAELMTTHTTGRDTNPVVLKLRAAAHKCAARDSQVCRRTFRIFENSQFVLQLRLQASMQNLNAHYPLDNW